MLKTIQRSQSFFSRDKFFYRNFFNLAVMMILRNVLTYSVNIADNIMLGSYNQQALSGAAVANQIQFVLQCFVISGLGDGLVVVASQYWGQNRLQPVKDLTGIALVVGIVVGVGLTFWTSLAPDSILRLFTNDPAVLQQGKEYLSIIRFTYLLFILSNLLLMALRSIEIVKIGFWLSAATLGVNVTLNYIFIYGHFGAPELGIRGAALATLVARSLECLVVVLYCLRKLPLRLGEVLRSLFSPLAKKFLQVSLPCVVSALLFSGAIAMQTAILGHLSADALAANSAATTLFQYLKMIPVSVASASSVLIGKAVGSGDFKQLRQYSHTLQALYAGIGLLSCAALLVLRAPVLSLYTLTPCAKEYAWQILTILAFISAGTAYEMPCQCGIIRGGGDTRYVMISDFIYSWLIVVPLSLAAAFWWHFPLWIVVVCLNCDQLLKCITVGIKTNRYTWIKTLTKD